MLYFEKYTNPKQQFVFNRIRNIGIYINYSLFPSTWPSWSISIPYNLANVSWFITVCIFPIKDRKILIQNEIYYSNKYIVQD